MMKQMAALAGNGKISDLILITVPNCNGENPIV